MVMHRFVGTVFALGVTTAAVADLQYVYAHDVSDAVGTPSGLTTFRFYAYFSEPTDQLLAVSGASVGAPLEFRTSTVLVNDGGAISGLKQEDFAYFPISAAWDSWVTIGHDEFAGNDTDYSPGFLDNDGVHAVIVGSEWSDDNDGWYDSNGASPALAGDDLRVLIAQFTVIDPPMGFYPEVDLKGTVVWLPEGGGFPLESPFTYDSSDVPCDVSHQFEPTSPPADVDGDGAVGFADLLAVLGAWGACEPAFDLIGQQRNVQAAVAVCEANPDCSPCDCNYRYKWADGLGRFDASVGESVASATATSVVGAHQFELDGSVSVTTGGAACVDGVAESQVRLNFVVHEPHTSFAFTASAPNAQIILSGPTGFELVAPVDTTGVLPIGAYELNAEARVTGYPGHPTEVATLEYALDIADGRCAADVDRDGVVGLADLLDVLFNWGP